MNTVTIHEANNYYIQVKALILQLRSKSSSTMKFVFTILSLRTNSAIRCNLPQLSSLCLLLHVEFSQRYKKVHLWNLDKLSKTEATVTHAQSIVI